MLIYIFGFSLLLSLFRFIFRFGSLLLQLLRFFSSSVLRLFSASVTLWSRIFARLRRSERSQTTEARRLRRRSTEKLRCFVFFHCLASLRFFAFGEGSKSLRIGSFREVKKRKRRSEEER
uniref:Uncharacterized protein n=1 Tax=Pediastrum duplex TaxID=3105 RepID=A0A2U8GJ40_PEDDU|nr:hypothetical protein [Pediastrum duplex]